MTIRSMRPASRRVVLRLFLLACGWLGLGTAAAAPREFHLAPTPEWVQQIAPAEPTVVPTEQVSEGVYYLLTDTQTRVSAHGKVRYSHTASKALNERGVESVAHIEIGFDPSYETLTLHMIQLRRGGRVIPKLASASVKVLQREKELEALIYDGGKTANVFLDDVRVGDVVEYAYSLHGSNPVFGHRQFGSFDLQWEVPVHHLHARLLWPRERSLEVLPRNGAVQAVVSERGNHREYVWQTRDVPALVLDSKTPSWFDPYPSVQWGEFKDWQSVARWAVPYYRPPQRLSPALKAEVDRIAATHSTPEERLVAALQFVQREIRYLGIEIGPGSHAPSSPQQVLERRFGDCKDKSLLTVTLLQAMGIDARAALVHTTRRRGIRELQPTPYAFNHVLVQARIAGKNYWVDPTRAPQKGDLKSLYQPDFEAALLVDDASTTLVSMANDSSKLRQRTIHTLYEAQDGFDKPVRYTVTTVAHGAGAENLRSTLATENREDLQKRYLNFYARYFPKLAIAAPMSVQEDERDNRITVTERYLIHDFWQRSDAEKRLEASIYVPELDEYLRSPRDPIRTGPLALAHPVNLTHSTEVRLPESWGIKTETTQIDDAGFVFERQKSEKDKVLLLVDSFQSRTDHIAPTDTARYAANLERARISVDYVLYRYDAAKPAVELSGTERFNWALALLAALLLAGFGSLALKRYRHDPPATPTELPANQACGIRGWLILPAIMVVLMPIALLLAIDESLPSYANDTWSSLTTVGGASYHPMKAPTLLFELASNIGLLVFSLLLLVMFFQKRRDVPGLSTRFMAISVVIGVAALALHHTLPSDAEGITPYSWVDLGIELVLLGVWTAYFGRSRRVKATFVNTHEQAVPLFSASPPDKLETTTP